LIVRQVVPEKIQNQGFLNMANKTLLPQRLLERGLFGRWKIIIQNGEELKIPLCVKTGQAARTNFQEDWCEYSHACEIRLGRGVAVLMSTQQSQESTTEWICIDFDKIDQRSEEQKKRISNLATIFWSEISYSQNGIHLFVEVLKEGFIYDHKCKIKNEEIGPIEIYSNLRFIAVTGQHASLCDDNIAPISMSDLEELLHVLLSKSVAKVQKENKNLAIDTVVKNANSAYPAIPITLQENYWCQHVFSNAEVLLKSNPVLDLEGDRSTAVFNFVRDIFSFCSSRKQLFDIFYASPLATEKYNSTGDDKLPRVFDNYILPKLLLTVSDSQKRLGLAQSPFDYIEPEFDVINFQKQKLKKNTNGFDRIDENDENENKYTQLLTTHFGSIQRDIFGHDGFITYKAQEFNIFSPPVLDSLKEYARRLNETEDLKGNARLKYPEIQPALQAKLLTIPAKLMINIPDWDGVDRIRDMAKCLITSDGFTSVTIEHIMKDWIVKTIHRVFAFDAVETTQNRILLFIGKQGIGKDTFLDTLTGGWQRYALNLSKVSKNSSDKDIFEQVYNKIVVSLPEIDRFHQPTLKNLITAPYYSFRQSYGRAVNTYQNRASYVASANPDRILTDPTGNRRFVLIKLEGIKHEYGISLKDRIQVLAQGFQMWRDNANRPLEANESVEQKIRKVLIDNTPLTVTEFILDDLRSMVENKREIDASYNFEGQELFEVSDFANEISKIAQNYKMRTSYLRQYMMDNKFMRKIAKAPFNGKFIVGLPQSFHEKNFKQLESRISLRKGSNKFENLHDDIPEFN
jgi:hypothetical protein